MLPLLPLLVLLLLLLLLPILTRRAHAMTHFHEATSQYAPFAHPHLEGNTSKVHNNPSITRRV